MNASSLDCMNVCSDTTDIQSSFPRDSQRTKHSRGETACLDEDTETTVLG